MITMILALMFNTRVDISVDIRHGITGLLKINGTVKWTCKLRSTYVSFYVYIRG